MSTDRGHVAFKPGTVTAVNVDDQTYRVLPDSGKGSAAAAIDGVRCMPVDAALIVGDRVLLMWQRPGDQPFALAIGGGEFSEDLQGFFQGPRDLGHAFLSE